MFFTILAMLYMFGFVHFGKKTEQIEGETCFVWSGKAALELRQVLPSVACHFWGLKHNHFPSLTFSVVDHTDAFNMQFFLVTTILAEPGPRVFEPLQVLRHVFKEIDGKSQNAISMSDFEACESLRCGGLARAMVARPPTHCKIYRKHTTFVGKEKRNFGLRMFLSEVKNVLGLRLAEALFSVLFSAARMTRNAGGDGHAQVTWLGGSSWLWRAGSWHSIGVCVCVGCVFGLPKPRRKG